MSNIYGNARQHLIVTGFWLPLAQHGWVQCVSWWRYYLDMQISHVGPTEYTSSCIATLKAGNALKSQIYTQLKSNFVSLFGAKQDYSRNVNIDSWQKYKKKERLQKGFGLWKKLCGFQRQRHVTKPAATSLLIRFHGPIYRERDVCSPQAENVSICDVCYGHRINFYGYGNPEKHVYI